MPSRRRTCSVTSCRCWGAWVATGAPATGRFRAKAAFGCRWSDGTVEDVPPLCRFQTNDDSVARIDATGQATAVNPGDTHMVAFYDNGVAAAPALLPVSGQVGPRYPAVATPTKIDELVVSK